jgi:ABC-type antimicrobial peptide transport system permease subunit
VLTALGLACGVALMIGIVGAGQGLTTAQDRVLSPLSDVGTDLLVTRVAGGTAAAISAAAPTTSVPSKASAESGGLGAAGGFFGSGAAGLDEADAAALLSDNDAVVVDLSKLGPAGTSFVHDFFMPATLLTFPDDAVRAVAALPDVSSVTGGLTMLAEHQSGTVPNVAVTVQTGEQQLQQTIKVEPLSGDERKAMSRCLSDSGLIQGAPVSGSPAGKPGAVADPTTTAPAARPDKTEALNECLPQRYKEFDNQVVVPAQTIQRIVNPPKTDTTSASYTAAGVDPASPKAGLVTVDQVKSGRFLEQGADNDVLLSVAYANKKNLDVGSTVTINDQTFNVVGLVDPALTGNTADIYFSLAKLQELSSKPGRINEVLVKASKSADVDKVAKEVSDLLPGAQVVTTKALSQQVTGSLADAKKLADRLGGALAAIVLAAVLIIAQLLTLSSVAKRVREIGTLRAVGWSKNMVVRQVLFETVAIGLLGGILGIVLGFGVAAMVGVFSPTLSASATGVTAATTSRLGSQLFGSAVRGTGVTASTHLHAPVHLGTLLVGVGSAVIGGVLAGAVGGWRAARLSPVDAIGTVG